MTFYIASIDASNEAFALLATDPQAHVQYYVDNVSLVEMAL